ncbi:MAG: aminotransferase class V-fold PLP-dependent enzyme [Candidatus Algichlamydia australiensis]|nr:aminotransferase class V-fold PLP-dependent enzyme [Chlamydiales bacterium]
MKPLFFDGAQKPNRAALDALLSFSRDHFQALDQPYSLQGREGRLIEETFDEVHRFVCASKKDQLFFISSTEEALNAIGQALYLDLIQPTGRNHILTTRVHAKVFEPFAKAGVVTKIVEPNEEGLITPEQVAKAISPRTCLLSLPWADEKTGVIYPIWEIAKVARDQGVYVHVDASAILGKMFFRFEDLPIDFLSFEGQAIGAPKGTGALFQKFITPIHVALSKIPASPAELIAIGEAIFELRKRSEFASLEMARLRNLLEEQLPKAEKLYAESERLPQVSCMRFPGVHAEALLYYLVDNKLYATLFPEKNALSFTITAEMSEEDIEEAVDRIQECCTKLGKLSPC